MSAFPAGSEPWGVSVFICMHKPFPQPLLAQGCPWLEEMRACPGDPTEGMLLSWTGVLWGEALPCSYHTCMCKYTHVEGQVFLRAFSDFQQGKLIGIWSFTFGGKDNAEEKMENSSVKITNWRAWTTIVGHFLFWFPYVIMRAHSVFL